MIDFEHDFAERLLGIGVDSYSRLDCALDLFDDYPDRRLECFGALGLAWSECDNIWTRKNTLRALLRRASRAELDAMMTADEIEIWRSMPPTLTVYRGCYKLNRIGLSWTTDREQAVKFPSYLRYRIPGAPALLRTGRVRKDVVIYKSCRGENEIIAPDVRLTKTERIP